MKHVSAGVMRQSFGWTGARHPRRARRLSATRALAEATRRGNAVRIPILPRRLALLPWLALAACLLYVASLNDPVSLAAWFWPVFLLRFMRQSHPAVAFLMSLAVLSTASYFA